MDLQQYEKALKQINRKVQSLEKPKQVTGSQATINFEAGEANKKVQEERTESDNLKKKFREDINDQIENEKNANVRNWQRNT